MKAGFTGIYEANPNTQTVRFGDKYINLSALARVQNLDGSYLSRIFAGKRTPSIPHAMKLAAVLGMRLDEFLEDLEKHNKELVKTREFILNAYQKRVAKEAEEDLKAIKAGKHPQPRIPLIANVLQP